MAAETLQVQRRKNTASSSISTGHSVGPHANIASISLNQQDVKNRHSYVRFLWFPAFSVCSASASVWYATQSIRSALHLPSHFLVLSHREVSVLHTRRVIVYGATRAEWQISRRGGHCKKTSLAHCVRELRAHCPLKSRIENCRDQKMPSFRSPGGIIILWVSVS